MATLARAACKLLSGSRNKLLLRSPVRFCHTSSQLPVLTLFTKEDCQLCEEALEELGPFLDQVKLKEVDIEEEGRDEEYNKYRYEIPVFFLNNKFLCKNRIELEKFHSALDDIRNSVK